MSKLRLIFSILTIVGVSVFASIGGPDAFGYRWIDSDEPGGPTFEWIDISTTGTMGPSGDDAYSIISLPRSFEFYGMPYNQLTICTNGWVALGSWATSSLSIDTIPSTTWPQNEIAMCHMDLHTGTGSIRYRSLPDGRFVVSYIAIREYGGTGEQFWFQCVFDFDRSTITLNYLRMLPVTSTYRKGFIGIENSTGTIGLCYGRIMAGSSPVHDSLSIRFRAQLVVSPPYFNDCYTAADFEHEGSVNDWELGRPLSVGPTTTHSFPYCWCTKREANYSPNSNSILYPPRLSIAGCGQPIFDWWQWYDIDATDGGTVQISTNDGLTWSVLPLETPYPVSALPAGTPLAGLPGFSGTSGGVWQYRSADLSAFVPYGEVWIRFNFASDGSIQRAGWYIDDIGLSESFGYLKGYVDLDYRDDNSGARVRVAELGLSATTNAAGYYFIDSVKVGTWTIICTRDSFATQMRTDVSFARNDTVRVDFLMPPVLMATNFDTNSAGGVAIPPNGWQWGRPDSLVAPPFAHSDSLCWGTNLGGNYANNANWTLNFTVFLVANRPHMSVWHWYKFAGYYAGYFWDGGNVKCKGLHDTVWTIVYPRDGYDGTCSGHNTFLGGQPCFGGDGFGDFWRQDIFDLSAWAMDTAIIRFEIGTDPVGTARGWYIDDLVITDYSEIEETITQRPNAISIKTYPNPFNSLVTIEYSLPVTGTVEMEILDITGRSVMRYSIRNLARAGTYRISWDGKDTNARELPSGMYLARIRCGNLTQTARLLLLK